jgi:hypothetical protein
VTNGDHPLSKTHVRKAHEQVVALISKYLQKTAKTLPSPIAPPETLQPPPPAASAPADDLEDLEPDPALDAETSAMHAP